MTIGIYALYWEEQALVYIGLSQNIEKSRFKDHLSKLKNNKHSNYKVQNAYNKYGNPKLVIIEECLIEELNDKEIYWTEEFDSINNGLNIVEAGFNGGYGENHGSSKYSNEQIIEVFKLLVNNKEKSFKEIKEITKISINIIRDISAGNSHYWLEQEFPEEYKILLSLKGNRSKTKSAKERGIIYPLIKSPENIEYNIENIRKFAKEHNLNASVFGQVLRGQAKQHKGWKLA